MKQLVKFELYKLFRQKGIYITMGLMFILFSMISLSAHIPTSPYKALELKGDLQLAAENWEGAISEKKLDNASNIQELLIPKSIEGTLSEKEVAEQFVIMSLFDNETMNSLVIPNRLSELQNYMSKLSASDFSYKEALLEKNMLEDLNFETFIYSKGPQETIGFAYYSRFFTSIMILIGLATIFVNETNTGMDQLIYSSTHGRRKSITAKIFASIIYVLFVILSWLTFDVLMNMYVYGNSGWDAPIQMITQHTPYNLTMLEFFLIQTGIHILVAIAFMTLVLVVSALSKNTLMSFIISASIFILPTISFSIPFWDYVMKYSFANFITAPDFVNSFHAINLFGIPVLDPLVHYPMIFLLSIILLIAIYRTIKRKQIA
ncbi:ABC transporter permease subunit [Cytobacillus sp. IB215665]|uniref:ABC transporter permease n=1 Tax=Cytobacillus sp. IB215665 TaxID=3097357 RepID=UPI002A108620|nr:ABC transporter permease subunit [Cytobacillus sp. IB215665]MDX8366325.1 ABC transporter permease subunit [Cytobacillus sp. IB215665]